MHTCSCTYMSCISFFLFLFPFWCTDYIVFCSCTICMCSCMSCVSFFLFLLCTDCSILHKWLFMYMYMYVYVCVMDRIRELLLWSYGCISLNNSAMLVSRKISCNSEDPDFPIFPFSWENRIFVLYSTNASLNVSNITYATDRTLNADYDKKWWWLARH